MDAMESVASGDINGNNQLDEFNKKWQASIDAKALEEKNISAKLQQDAEAELAKWNAER